MWKINRIKHAANQHRRVHIRARESTVAELLNAPEIHVGEALAEPSIAQNAGSIARRDDPVVQHRTVLEPVFLRNPIGGLEQEVLI